MRAGSTYEEEEEEGSMAAGDLQGMFADSCGL